MRWGHIEFVGLLLLIPILIVFFYWGYNKKNELLEKFIDKELKERFLENYSIYKRKWKIVMILSAIFFLILSLMRPQWGFKWEEIQQKGVDILIALDVSESMLAEDISPNRLERAKFKISDFLQMVEGDRIGLIAFAGVSFLQSPLTLDYGAIKIFLDDISTDLIPIPGTALGDAIDLSIKSFDSNDPRSRVLILITDGEDHLGNPLENAKKASKENIKIYTIGIGAESGAPIPDRVHGGFKKDRNGEMVITKIDEEILQKIALETGGSYVRSVSGDLDLEKIYQDIRKSVEEKELKSGKQKRYEERFQWPLLLVFVFLFLEVLINEKKVRKSILILLLFFIPWNLSKASILNSSLHDGVSAYEKGDYNEALKKLLEAQIENPNDMKLKYNLANTYYKLGQYKEAENLFQSTAEQSEKELSLKSYYNLGNTHYKVGKLQEAIESYEEALKIDPNDEDSKHNLAFVRDEIKKRIEEQKKRQSQQNQQSQKNDSSNSQQDQDQQQNQQQEGKSQGDQKESGDQKNQQQSSLDKNQDKRGGTSEEEMKGKQENKKDDTKRDGMRAGEEGQDKKESGQEKGVIGAEKKDGDKMSEEEASRMLSILKDERKNYYQKKSSQQGRGYKVEKDW